MKAIILTILVALFGFACASAGGKQVEVIADLKIANAVVLWGEDKPALCFVLHPSEDSVVVLSGDCASSPSPQDWDLARERWGM